MQWPWRVGLNPKAACLLCLYTLCVWLPLPSPFSVWNTFSGEEMWSLHHSAICPYSSLVHLLRFLQKSPPTTSGFQFPVSYGPHAVSDRVWGAWHRAQHFQRGLIINMQIPTELSDIYSPVSGDLQSLEFSFVSGTACALHVVNLQQESIQSRLQGIHLARLLRDK